MKDKIIIKNMKVYGYHGVLKEERVLGQNYFIDIEMFTCLKKASHSDNINDSIDYSEVYYDIVELSNNNNFFLIETFAEKICDSIMKRYNIKKVITTVKKPDAPINGNFDYVGVTIQRENTIEL